MSYGAVKQQLICEKTLDYLFQDAFIDDFAFIYTSPKHTPKSKSFMSLMSKWFQPKHSKVSPVLAGDE
jgi:hypothetical protein